MGEEPQAPDPLGRRSLYWATGGAVGDRASKRSRDTIPLGKHALYSQAPANGRSGASGSERVAEPASRGGFAARGSDVLGAVVVDCSRCGARSAVGMGKFITLHFPVWLWRPGPGYARLMTCPSCRRRSWLSASWRPWQR